MIPWHKLYTGTEDRLSRPRSGIPPQQRGLLCWSDLSSAPTRFAALSYRVGGARQTSGPDSRDCRLERELHSSLGDDVYMTAAHYLYGPTVL